MSEWNEVRRPRSVFFGREAELAELAALHERLVTIVGPPGIGKTRLAFEHASRAHARGERVLYTSLAEHETLDDALASLGGARANLAELFDGAGKVTIVLDELERAVPEMAPLVSQWLERNREASFVCTSRAKLGCQGERTIELGPLATEDALALLADRAGPRYAPEGARRGVLLRIVERFDRMPLAIELIAGSAKVLTPEELIERHPETMGRLESAELEGRHRTLDAAIASSFSSVSEPTRRALSLACVFRGGFSLEAFEQVIGPLLGDGVSSLDVLGALCNASLLAAFDSEDGRKTRFATFAVVTAFAWPLASEADRANVRAAHLRYFAGVARRENRTPAETLSWSALEAGNLGLAYETATAGDSADALAILLAIDPLARIQGPLERHERRLDRAIDAGIFDPRLLARAIVARAHVRSSRGDIPGALRDLATVQRIVDLTGHGDIESEMLAVLTIVMQSQGQLDEGITLLEQKLDRTENPDLVLRSLGVMLLSRGRLEAALDAFERALVLARKRDDSNHVGALHALIGVAQQELGDIVRARDELETAVAHATRIGDRVVCAAARNWLGQVCLDEGDLAAARVEIEKAHSILSEIGESWFRRATVGYLGILDHLEGDLDRAEARLSEAVTLAMREGDHYRLGNFQPHLGAVLAARGDITGARAAFAESRQRAAVSPCPNLHPIASLLEAFVDRAGVGLRVARARRAAKRSSDVRFALLVVEQRFPVFEGEDELAKAAPKPSALSVCASSSWFAIGSGRAADLSRRTPLRRLFACLVEAHARTPGVGVPTERLLAAGWPDERMLRDAGLHRVHVAVATLRRLGLGDMLSKQSDGYLIDPLVDVVIEEAATAP